MIPALIFSFLLWAGTIVLAYFWAERRYNEGYRDGYGDAEDWVQRTTSTAGAYFGRDTAEWWEEYGYTNLFGDEP